MIRGPKRGPRMTPVQCLHWPQGSRTMKNRISPHPWFRDSSQLQAVIAQLKTPTKYIPGRPSVSARCSSLGPHGALRKIVNQCLGPDNADLSTKRKQHGWPRAQPPSLHGLSTWQKRSYCSLFWDKNNIAASQSSRNSWEMITQYLDAYLSGKDFQRKAQ